MNTKYCLKSTVSFESINNSHVNRSKSKQTFSFCKSPRFQTIQPNCAKNSYAGDVIQRQNSGISVGRAKRSDFTKTTIVSPGVSKYNIKPLFDENQMKTKGYSLRMSREKINFGSYINKETLAVPPPTRYDYDKKQRIKSPSYTIRSRTKILDKSKTLDPQNNNPGPGNYQNPEIDINSKYSSKFNKIGYSSTKSKRFQPYDNFIPGPGNYHDVSSLSKVGKYILSNHPGGTKAIFDHQKRISKFDQVKKQANYQPGPGSYKIPSQFGQYDGDVYENIGRFTSARDSKRVGSNKN